MPRRANRLRLLIAAALAAAAAPVSARQDADHVAHHPEAADAGATAAAAPAKNMSVRPSAGTTECVDCGHSEYRQPLYPRLLSLAPADTQGRRELAVEAEHRMMTAAAVIHSASAAIASNQSDETTNAALDRLRQSTSEYESAAAVLKALQAGTHSQALGLDWFRGAMNLQPIPHTEPTGIFGLSALHLLIMTLVGLLAAGLLALQLVRLRRARSLITPALLPAGTDQAPGTASALAVPNETAATLTTVRPRTRRWSGQLRVAHIANETPTVETYRLVAVEGGELPFDFLPGQFLQVQVEPEPGKPTRRSYTIASSPTQRAFVEITVKREDHGAVSKFLNEKLAVGDLLQVSGPFGSFTFTGSDADSIVLIAGGVGITPIMSVLRYLTDKAWPGEIFVLYGARSTEEFVFREEIERLEKRHANLHVLATMQRAPGTVWLGPEGTLTKELVAAAVPKIAERRIHLCGPPPMMAAMKKLLLELGVAEAQIRSEAFGPASLPPENAPSAVTAATEQGPVKPAPTPVENDEVAATTVTFSVSGVAAPLQADETVLEAAEGAGVEIPYSCRVGECGVCVTKLVQGTVTMAVEKGLDPTDKAQGYILACQAKTTGEPLVVEA